LISPLDNYFLQQQEPIKGCLLFLRKHILAQNEFITEGWSYGMPFYYYKGKRFCYLWVHKKYYQPYIGVVDGNLIEHANLIKEDRARMKIFLLDAKKDIPVETLDEILKEVLKLYK
jgi:Domain of unknown function (DU1801)